MLTGFGLLYGMYWMVAGDPGELSCNNRSACKASGWQGVWNAVGPTLQHGITGICIYAMNSCYTNTCAVKRSLAPPWPHAHMDCCVACVTHLIGSCICQRKLAGLPQLLTNLLVMHSSIVWAKPSSNVCHVR